jgi:hypothetical protein
MKRILETQLIPQLPAGFQWPDRYGLDDLLMAEKTKRVANYSLMFGRNLLPRQEKVVRHQITHLASFQQLDVTAAKRKLIRFVCTRWVVARVNRWTCLDNFDMLWDRHAPEDADSADIVLDLQALVDAHHAHFGPSPLARDFYRLSEKDAGINSSCYVHYFCPISHCHTVTLVI